MARNRDLFVVMAEVDEDGVGIAVSAPMGNCSTKQTVEFIVTTTLFAVSTLGEDSKPQKPSEEVLANCIVFDSEGHEIPLYNLVEEIPQPGILIILDWKYRNSPVQESEKVEYAGLIAVAIMHRLEDEENYKDFLESRGAKFEPLSPARYDVFISYSSEDQKVANEIMKMLTTEGLRCFLASKSIGTGTLWKNEIRNALHESRVVVILLTPNSISSAWVLVEAGAFWALSKPIVPAMQFVNINDLPQIISDHQARDIVSTEDRADFVKEVKRLCRGSDV